MHPTDAEREVTNLTEVERLFPENGSSPGQNLALTVLCVPCSLDSGTLKWEAPITHQREKDRERGIEGEREREGEGERERGREGERERGREGTGDS